MDRLSTEKFIVLETREIGTDIELIVLKSRQAFERKNQFYKIPLLNHIIIFLHAYSCLPSKNIESNQIHVPLHEFYLICFSLYQKA